MLVCTDLDRTLIANGPQPESAGARARFDALVARPEVMLTYVSGRHRRLITRAISTYRLPRPDFVVADVGTTIYEAGGRRRWRRSEAWEDRIAVDWNGKSRTELMELLNDLPDLRPQERSKQNRFKLSYYLPLTFERDRLDDEIRHRMERYGVNGRLIWSIDDPAGVGLLDILPARASKLHALEYLMRRHGFDLTDTVFCGDSGNDLEVLVSPIPSVLVANASDEVRAQALELADRNGHGAGLYAARGGLFGMNGNYSAGMLEGIAHFYPRTLAWMTLPRNSPVTRSEGGGR
jgi:HAD superfamily hydrolase (TIGR01484 family)